MTRTKNMYLALVAVLLSPMAANATLLTFEDIPGGSTHYSLDWMPVYKGFNFSRPLAWIDVGTVGSVSPPPHFQPPGFMALIAANLAFLTTIILRVRVL
jgi:hypothetical protein